MGYLHSKDALWEDVVYVSLLFIDIIRTASRDGNLEKKARYLSFCRCRGIAAADRTAFDGTEEKGSTAVESRRLHYRKVQLREIMTKLIALKSERQLERKALMRTKAVSEKLLLPCCFLATRADAIVPYATAFLSSIWRILNCS